MCPGWKNSAVSALQVAIRDCPGLALVDIQLADKSSGTYAEHENLTEISQTPVILIAHVPHPLLIGGRPEPAFLITTPFS